MADDLYTDDLDEMEDDIEDEDDENEDDEEADEFGDDYEADEDDEADVEPQYRESVMFDGIDFVRNVLNKVETASTTQAYEQWCRTCIATEKGSLFLYSEDFGIDMESVRSAETFEEKIAILSGEIEDALMADPAKRTLSVDLIEVEELEDDGVELAVTVTGADYRQVSVDATVEI